MFCAAQHDLPPDSSEIFKNNHANLFEDTIKLSVWMSQRYYEVTIFRILQNAANRLESCSTNELSDIVGALLTILTIGSVETCELEDGFLVRMDITCLNLF